ncbi:unnamed protein product [Sphagnum troendelagicum]|uniref:Uncharacterized protein n=1 Tax=Sphagnum troendelagicum TaxID=128251 RepID=A0ABP0THS9_9BRYO
MPESRDDRKPLRLKYTKNSSQLSSYSELRNKWREGDRSHGIGMRGSAPPVSNSGPWRNRGGTSAPLFTSIPRR